MNYSDRSILHKLKLLKSGRMKLLHQISMRAAEGLVILIVFAAVTGSACALGMFRGILAGTPEFDPKKVQPTGFFSSVYDSQGNVTAKLVGGGANRIEADFDEFPEDLVDAFVAIEDSRFWQHSGIDLRSIGRAVTGVLTDNYSGGASTITQQLIKNTIFNGGMESNSGARLERKIQEQYLALQLTRNVDRRTILTNYLNTINLGSDTLGVKAAALRYFDKDVSSLTLSECAVIAGITQNPSRYNPLRNPEANASRREIILNEMYKQGYITAEEQEEALADDVYSRISSVNAQAAGTNEPYSYYVDELLTQVTEALKEKYGYTDTQAWNMLYTGGLSIYTPQDPDLQKIVDEEVNNPDNYDAARYSLEYRCSVNRADGSTEHFSQEDVKRFIRNTLGNTKFDGLFNSTEEIDGVLAQFRESIAREGDTPAGEFISPILEPQTSFVLIDHKNGHVAAISGGRGEKKASRTLNRATDMPRQPGSTFKIITTFAPALDACGATLATVYYDAPYRSGEKVFRNWWTSGYKGYHTIRDGIVFSMNIVALRCMEETVTPQLGVDYARRLGISTLTSTDYNLSTALGGITRGVTNLELTDAFAAIANGGVYTEPVFYTRVLDKDGNVILENKPEQKQVLKSSTAWLLTDAMADSMQANTLYEGSPGIHSTGTTAALEEMSCAGKSGTTTDNVDVWFVGFTPYYTAGVWGGCDQSQSLKNDRYGDENGGTSFHKRIWRNIMTRVHEGMNDSGFPMPEEIEEAPVCRKSGKMPVEGVCSEDPRGPAVYNEYFARGTVPSEACDHHVRVTVCGASGQRPTELCPPAGLIQKTVMTVPDNEGETDDTTFSMPGYCSVHGGGGGETGGEAGGEDEFHWEAPTAPVREGNASYRSSEDDEIQW